MMWRTTHLLHLSPEIFWACLIAAVPRSSDVAGTAAFSLLVLSQHHMGSSRVDTGSATEMPVTQARERVGRGVDGEVRYRGQDTSGAAIA